MPTWKLYREGGEVVETELERWRWEVQYDDGSELKQFDDHGIYHQFKEIQQDRIHSFRMVSDDAPPITISWSPDYKLIHFYRNTCLNFGLPNETRIRMYCFGYQFGAIKTIFVIMPDDSVFVVDDADRIKLE
jgi:hypothetical protein